MYCRHGSYVGTPLGIDLLCGFCEDNNGDQIYLRRLSERAVEDGWLISALDRVLSLCPNHINFEVLVNHRSEALSNLTHIAKRVTDFTKMPDLEDRLIQSYLKAGQIIDQRTV